MRNFVAGAAALFFFAALPVLGQSYCDSVAGNLVMNCGFETGNFTDWTLSGNTNIMTVSTAFPHTGSSAAALGSIGRDGYLTQSLATTAGDTYQLQFWLDNDYYDYGPPNDFDVSLDGGTTELYSATNIAAQPYTEYTFSFVAAGSTALQFSSRDDNGYLLLDDIVVTPATPSAVPEPASVVLLLSLTAIAGIALRRRIGHRQIES